MSIVLKRDTEYQKVMCPHCCHEWWEQNTLSSFGASNKVACANCGARLIMPKPNTETFYSARPTSPRGYEVEV